MLPHHPLFSHFGNELIVGTQKVEWMVQGHDFLLRPLNADARVVWCELGRRDMPAALAEPLRLERVQKRLAKNIRDKRLWRYWPLDEERELVLRPEFALLRPQDADFWMRLDWLTSPELSELMFNGDLTPIVAHLEPDDGMWKLAEAIRLEGALNWFVCSRGDRDELKRLIWACGVLWRYSFHASGRGALLLSLLMQARYDASNEQRIHLKRLCDVLDAHFVLVWHLLASRVHNSEGKPQRKPHVLLHPLPSPSMHDQLEAMLVWREFLSGKVPAEEIDALLKV